MTNKYRLQWFPPSDDDGGFDGYTPEGFYYKYPGQAWQGPYVDREHAEEAAQTEPTDVQDGGVDDS